MDAGGGGIRKRKLRVTLPLLEETNVAAKQGTIQRTPLNREMVATVSDAVLMGVNRIRAAK